MLRSFGKILVLAVFLGTAAFSVAIPFSAAPVSAQESLRVSNHVFTTRVIRSADGTFFVQDVLVGFERGTASFQTLTQVVLPQGAHHISLALLDPNGNELSRIDFPAIRATSGNWTQSLEGTWRNIRFAKSGLYQLVLYLEKRPAARFSLVVT